MSSTDLTRYVAYGLAIAVGLAGLIGGIAAGQGVLAGVAAGWLVDAGILIVRRQTGQVQQQGSRPTSVFSMFEVTPVLGAIFLVILIAGGVIGYFIKH